MRALFTDTHNVAEGAGAAALAALMQERAAYRGRRAAAILCGGNVDANQYVEVLSGPHTDRVVTIRFRPNSPSDRGS